MANGFGVDDSAPYGLGGHGQWCSPRPDRAPLYRGWLDDADEGEGPHPANPFDPDGAKSSWPGSTVRPAFPATRASSASTRRPCSGYGPISAHSSMTPRVLTGTGSSIGCRRMPPGRGSSDAGPAPDAGRAAGTRDQGVHTADWEPPRPSPPGRDPCRLPAGRVGRGPGSTAARRGARDLGHSLHNAGQYGHHSRQHHVFEERSTTNGDNFDVNIVCINADQLPLREPRPDRASLPTTTPSANGPGSSRCFPRPVPWCLGLVDEVWAISEFTRARSQPPRPSRSSPFPTRSWLRRSPGIDRALGLPEDRTLFLFCFDLLSVLERKNPLGLVDAYCKSVRPRGMVHSSSLKSSMGQVRPGSRSPDGAPSPTGPTSC